MTETLRREVAPVRAEYLFDLVAELAAPRLDLGAGPLGRRVLDRTGTGSFDGPRLRGEILPGSGDWALYRADGVMVIDARVTLHTDDDALILMTYSGRVSIPDSVRPRLADPAQWDAVDPSEYYIRIAPLFETGAPAYQWLNRIVAVGTGYLIGGGIGYRVSALI